MTNNVIDYDNLMDRRIKVEVRLTFRWKCGTEIVD